MKPEPKVVETKIGDNTIRFESGKVAALANGAVVRTQGGGVAALPPRGVYAGRAHVNDLVKPAAINIGVNPTFGGDPSTSPLQIEAFVLDLDADLYDTKIRLEFWSRLRDEERFDSVDDLVAQMADDVDATRSLVVG